VIGSVVSKDGKTGGERLTWGKKGASDSTLLLAERWELTVSFAGNEALSKTCLER
jgi:hypothetical protein